MSELSKKLMANARPDKKGRRTDTAKDDELTPQEQRAFAKIQSESKEAGSELASGGKGGLPPSLVLGVFRRDKWRCKVCGHLGNMKLNGGLSVHHKYQHIQDVTERRKGMAANREGRRNDPSQMTSICAKDHDKVHERDRAENPGEPDADEAGGGDKGKR